MRPPVTSSPLPAIIPMEYNRLNGIAPIVLRNRLILLQQFTDLFCAAMPLLNTTPTAASEENSTVLDPCVAQTPVPSLSELLELSTHRTSFSAELKLAIDALRRLLIFSKKELVFKKVVQSSMVRSRSHGLTVEVNRMQVGTHG